VTHKIDEDKIAII